MAHLLAEIENYNESGRTTPLNGFKASKEPTPPHIHEVVLGNWWVRPWYPSFYPKELVGSECERLYVCPSCFKYTREVEDGAYLRHMDVCGYRKLDVAFGPPIYTQPTPGGTLAIHSLDGEDHSLFAQNLSLFAKLFLDSKSVMYDVSTFLFYILVLHEHSPKTSEPQIIGFFSKEKLSWDRNNLACILVFPPWQKRGFGQLLMGVSYYLGSREGRLGGPEKPLSEPGRRAYEQYWASEICRFVLGLPKSHKVITARGIGEGTGIVAEDVVGTLAVMGLLQRKTMGKKVGEAAVIDRKDVREWMKTHKVSDQSPIVNGTFANLPDLSDESEMEESE